MSLWNIRAFCMFGQYVVATRERGLGYGVVGGLVLADGSSRSLYLSGLFVTLDGLGLFGPCSDERRSCIGLIIFPWLC